MAARLLSVCLGLCFLCAHSTSAAAGKVADGTYFSPLGNFTVPVPTWRGLKIQDRNDEHFAIVSFLDRGDFPAPLISIVTLRLTPDVQSVFTDPPQRDDAYKKFLTGFAMPNLFLPVAPKSAVAHEEFVDNNEERSYFAVVNIPQGHTAFRDGASGKQADSVSGLLIFHNRDFMYLLRVEMKTLSNVTLSASALSPKDLESARQKLLQLRGSLKFGG